MKKVGFALVFFILLVSECLYGQDNKVLKTGVHAPGITLEDTRGNPVSLLSLKGKLVLIDFWASWCAPCMQEQPELKRLYAKYHVTSDPAQGLEIFGVSLDSKKEAWTRAIKRFNLPWTQVSDLKFWMSPVARDYGIESLPFNVLVNAEGIVVALNLHGKELETFVAQFLKKE